MTRLAAVFLVLAIPGWIMVAALFGQHLTDRRALRAREQRITVLKETLTGRIKEVNRLRSQLVQRATHYRFRTGAADYSFDRWAIEEPEEQR